ncbi:MAG: hypothetical protein WC359_11840 [Dehalococcoidia bacterium]
MIKESTETSGTDGGIRKRDERRGRERARRRWGGAGKEKKKRGVGGVPRSFTIATAPEHHPRRAPIYGRGHDKETGDSTHEKMSELYGASRSCKGIPMEALP